MRSAVRKMFVLMSLLFLAGTVSFALLGEHIFAATLGDVAMPDASLEERTTAPSSPAVPDLKQEPLDESSSVIVTVTPVPEPSTIALLGLGAVAFLGIRRRGQ